MPTEVHFHPDGYLYVRTPATTYGDTLQNAALDFGMTLPPMPVGVDDRIYAPGVRHALMNTDTGLVGGGPMSWDVGDRLIANVNMALAAQAARRAAAATVSPPLKPLQHFANDVDAAAGGIPINGLYRNGSVVQIRVT